MNVFSKLVFGLILASLVSGTAWAQERLGTIDLNRAWDRYIKTQKLKDMIKEEQTKDEQSLKDTAAKADALEKEYRALANKAKEEASSPDLSLVEKDKAAKAANDKLATLNDLRKEFDEDKARFGQMLEDMTQRRRNIILDEIRNEINAQAKQAGYSMVIDISAKSVVGTPVVLYMASTNNDLTDKVLEDLNRAASALLEQKPASKQP